MIRQVTMFEVVCDGCGEKWSNWDGICAYADQDHTEQSARDSEWEEKGGEHYCPNCYSIDDNDNIVFKTNNNGDKE